MGDAESKSGCEVTALVTESAGSIVKTTQIISLCLFICPITLPTISSYTCISGIPFVASCFSYLPTPAQVQSRILSSNPSSRTAHISTFSLENPLTLAADAEAVLDI